MEQHFWIVTRATSAEDRTSLDRNGMCIEEISDTSVAGTIDGASMRQLVKSGIVIEQSLPLECYVKQIIESQITRSNYQFTSYTSMVTQLQKLATDNNDILTLSSAGLSCEGRNLWILLLTNNASNSVHAEKPGILFVGNHHAREHISAEVCLGFARYLCEHKNSTAIKTLLDSIDIYILPMLNPDGVVYDTAQRSYAYWRKNRHVNKDKSIGVDLNRNYDYMWNSKTHMSSETYGGPNPFSEPETHTIQTFLDTHNNVKIFISYHSYGKLILYPWGCKKNSIENINDRNVHLHIAQTIARITGYKAIQASALYISPGDASDWAYGIKGMIALTIELMPDHAAGSGGFYPSNDQAINDDIARNIQAAIYLCSICDNPYKVLA
jgi:Zinc carboxypeptidase.